MTGAAGQFSFTVAAGAAAAAFIVRAGRDSADGGLSAGALPDDHFSEHGLGQKSAGTGGPVPVSGHSRDGQQSAGGGQQCGGLVQGTVVSLVAVGVGAAAGRQCMGILPSRMSGGQYL